MVTIGALPGHEGNDFGPAFRFRSHLQWILEHFRTGSNHGVRGKNPKRRFTESQEMGLVCARRTEMVAEVKGALGFA
jgi:hypothetical protein